MGMKRDVALGITGISKHQYYYKPKPLKTNYLTSVITRKHEGENVIEVPNDEVIEKICNIQKQPNTDYGYRKMTFALMMLGYIINHKKVYRLMKEKGLLKEKNKKSPRSFVLYRKILPSMPLELLEMDIKFVWIEEHKRYAYILTIIDTFTRAVLYWQVAYSVKKEQVKKAWLYIIENYLQTYDCLNRKMHIEVRNDNDSRFIAQEVQAFFKENCLNQVFTHPYTPQENGHIESFHAILSENLNKMKFWSLNDLEYLLSIFYDNYNNRRLHSSIAYLAPKDFWKLWELNLIERTVNEKKREARYKLKIGYYQVKQHTGNDEPEVCSLHDFFDPPQAVEKKSLFHLI